MSMLVGSAKKIKMPEELQFKPVCAKILDKLNERNDNRLVRLKTAGALQPSGPVFKHPTGCYGRQ